MNTRTRSRSIDFQNRFKLRTPQTLFYGWVIAACAAVIAFCSGPGQSYVFSVFLDPIIEDTGFSRTSISALYAVGSGASAVMVSIVSRQADRHGPRKMLLGVAVLLGAACMLMAASISLVMFVFAFAALRALGQGSLPINGTLLVAQWFVRFRGRAIALMGLGFAASTAVLPPLSRFLIDSIGWRGAYVVLGLIVWTVLLPIAWFVVRDRPEDMGLLPDGARHGPVSAGLGARPSASPFHDKRRVLTSPAFWMLALPLATSPFVVTALVFHQTGIFAERGLGPEVAAATFVPYAVATAPSVVVAGFVVDRIAPRLVFVLAMSLLVFALGAAQVIASPALAILYGAVLGIAGGFSQVLSGFIWAHFYGREGLGRVQGSGTMVGIAGAALGPLPVAALEAIFDSFRPAIGLMTALPVFAVIVMLLARPPRPVSDV